MSELPDRGDQSSSPKRYVVIGGGITGLAAAHRIHELAPDAHIELWDARDETGGVIQTVEKDGYLIERAADSFITNVPWALDLCRRIGFEDELIRTDGRFRKAFVLSRGRLLEVPQGFMLMVPSRMWPIMMSPILSLRGKLRLAYEALIPRRKTDADESLATFVKRRLGKETYERLVQPLIGGIYTADPEKLSMDATMPKFRDMEKNSGSLVRGALIPRRRKKQAEAKSSGARYSLFMTPRRGLASMFQAIVNHLPEDAVKFGRRVTKLSRLDDGRWGVESDEPEHSLTVDGVVVAVGAREASLLLQDTDAEMADEIAGIPYAGAAVVSFGFRVDQFERPLNGIGVVVPEIEGLRTLAVSFSSVKFAGRAPEGCVLMRAFIGGAKRPELADLSDQELMDAVYEELAPVLGITGEPHMRLITRCFKAMPQYHVGHLERVSRIEARAEQLPGLELAGNSYRGVGIPHCIHSGEQAAERLVGFTDQS